jgi:ABC transporter
MSDSPFVIESYGLTKRYGQVAAITELTFEVSRHRITGFLGRNGAGKSTTIKTLLGMVHPTSGRAKVLGHRIDDPRASRELPGRVAYVGEDKGLYPYMTVAELIRFTRAYVLILDRARLVLDTELDEVREHYRRVTLAFTTDVPEAAFRLPGVHAVRARGRQLTVMTDANTDAVVARAHSLDAVSVDVTPVSLRECFSIAYRVGRDARVQSLAGEPDTIPAQHGVARLGCSVVVLMQGSLRAELHAPIPYSKYIWSAVYKSNGNRGVGRVCRLGVRVSRLLQ